MNRCFSEVSIKGYKSIRELERLELKNINILIGANGAGKSNFVSFFRMIRALIGNRLDSFIVEGGGINDFLHKGKKKTKQIEASLLVGNKEEKFLLKPSTRETAVAQDSAGQVLTGAALGAALGALLGGGKGAAWGAGLGGLLAGEGAARQSQASSIECESSLGINNVGEEVSLDIAPYHFQDTSDSSPMRSSEIIQDNKFLRMDAANIAPFLLRLKSEAQNSYDDIIEAIRTVAPYFDDFTMNIKEQGQKQSVNLEWYQKDTEYYPMQPHHLSDGTIRFICLATALLQPNPPAIIIIDEPEIGLHPFAIGILAELMQAAAEKSQLIIATQSASLVDHFEPEDVIVMNRQDGASSFKRLKYDDLNVWLEEYSLGDLWRKNVIEGGPSHE